MRSGCEWCIRVSVGARQHYCVVSMRSISKTPSANSLPDSRSNSVRGGAQPGMRRLASQKSLRKVPLPCSSVASSVVEQCLYFVLSIGFSMPNASWCPQHALTLSNSVASRMLSNIVTIGMLSLAASARDVGKRPGTLSLF